MNGHFLQCDVENFNGQQNHLTLRSIWELVLQREGPKTLVPQVHLFKLSSLHVK